jgi:hypothetical protein
LFLLDKAVRHKDWNAVGELITLLPGENPPATAGARAEYVQRTQQVLAALRSARADLALSLSRVRAAAGFTLIRAQQIRQGFAVPPEF